jgi:hypothetical protein
MPSPEALRRLAPGEWAEQSVNVRLVLSYRWLKWFLCPRIRLQIPPDQLDPPALHTESGTELKKCPFGGIMM